MNKKSILSKREFSKKSSKKLINMFSKKNVGDNSLSSKDLNKSYHSSNPKNKSMFDFGNNRKIILYIMEPTIFIQKNIYLL